MQEQLIDAVQKITGKSIGVEFAEGMPHQAQYDAARKMISLAAMKNFTASNAFHEAFHAVSEHFLSSEQRRQLYKALRQGPVKQQLKALLADSPAAWEAAKANASELGAYAYQFWDSGALKLNADPGTAIGRIFKYLSDKWDAVNNWLRDQPSAEQMLQQIKDGAFADGAPSPAEIALAKNARPLSRVRDVTAQAFKLVDKLYDNFLYPYDTRIRDFGNPHLDKLAKEMYAQVGEKTGRRGLVQEMPIQIAKHLNALDKIMRDPSGSFGKTLEEMASGGDAAATDQAMMRRIRGWLDTLEGYQKDAGIKMGHVENYIPMSWSGEKIAANKPAFIQMLMNHRADIDKLNAELRDQSGKPGNVFKDLTPESIADMMAKRGTATGEFIGSAFDEHGAPQADHTLDRVFSFLDNADRRPFVRDDLASGLMRYAKQAVRKAEWTRRFGEKGELWDQKIEQAKEYGLSPAEADLMKNYKDDAFGAKLHDMNPTIRTALAANTVYQNYRVLSLSVLGNLTDPFGVGVRSGEMSDAWNAYKMAAGRMFKSGRNKTADLQALAETIGTLERTGVQDSITGMYGGVNIEGGLRTMNNALFRYNGMDGLTRSVRLAALSTAINFIAKHSQHPDGVRHLAELGLTPDDVQLNDAKQLKILESDGLTAAQSDKMQGALNRFVDEAAMRPNVGERPKWGANPYLAPLFHLKQYIFTFNKVINRKLEHELLEHGNVTPYLMAGAYIPIMSGTSMLRDMLTHGGSLPAQNGFMHYLSSGMGRSGLFGPSDLAEAATIGTASGNLNMVQQALGPTASQAMDAFAAIASPHNAHGFRKFVAESLPGGSLLQHYMP